MAGVAYIRADVRYLRAPNEKGHLRFSFFATGRAMEPPKGPFVCAKHDRTGSGEPTFHMLAVYKASLLHYAAAGH